MKATAHVFNNGNSPVVRPSKPFRLGAFEVWTSCDAQTGDIHLRPKPSEERRQTRLRELLALMGLSDTHMQNLLSISVQVFAHWCKIEASSMRFFSVETQHT